jgi:hypothetical protein
MRDNFFVSVIAPILFLILLIVALSTASIYWRPIESLSPDGPIAWPQANGDTCYTWQGDVSCVR